ncbi:hypothetical protein G6011_04065 [Alternaria panax]|uniref:DUF3669 domain-containing protein n=1 Tax=Alternaria panax TaxID=48097 RepID=A0AAD4IGG3_9PLEO|nr:hypothetical protein G6011_04065 [Alternaria panax]
MWPSKNFTALVELKAPATLTLILNYTKDIRTGRYMDNMVIWQYSRPEKPFPVFTSLITAGVRIAVVLSDNRMQSGVYEVPGTADVFKVANFPGKETDQLWNDYKTHVKVSELFEDFGRGNIKVQVPCHKYFVGMDDEIWWPENLDRFPNLDMPSNLLATERILPLTKAIRESLIDMYCPSEHHAYFKASASNKDCLVRIYLGKRSVPVSSKFKRFQLRNFQLHLDLIEELELDAPEFATCIAESLAIMHWACQSDANDVEFVLENLSPSTIASMKPNTSTWDAALKNFHRRTTHIWMLDFNRCAAFAPGTEGLKQLVHSFFRNDPYFPRPHAQLEKYQHLWDVFGKSYLATAQMCVNKGKLCEKFANLPSLFLTMVQVEQKRRLDAQAA